MLECRTIATSRYPKTPYSSPGIMKMETEKASVKIVNRSRTGMSEKTTRKSGAGRFSRVRCHTMSRCSATLSVKAERYVCSVEWKMSDVRDGRKGKERRTSLT